jgi:cytochrome c peroxidase
MQLTRSQVTLCLAFLTSTAHAQTLFPNESGASASVSSSGFVDLDGAFFESFGTNDRTCGTCHMPGDGWSVSVRTAQQLFDATGGTHPLFAFDGQNCPGEDRSTVEARRAASSLLLELGVIRLESPVPPGAEYELVSAEGTYCNAVSPEALVVFRRPLPTTNFDGLTVAFWSGGGNALFPNLDDLFPAVTVFGTFLHAEAVGPPPPEAVMDIVALMASLRTSQVYSKDAGNLDAKQSGAGFAALDASPLPTTGAPGFTLFDAWSSSGSRGGIEAARASVARGQALFNARCTGCHSSPNRGNSSDFRVIDLGLTGPDRSPTQLPMYTLRNLTTGELRETSDPGAALDTGRWADIARFKVPNLRAVATRAPYFHNGATATLDDVVRFYDERFALGLTPANRADLVHFLEAL